MTRSDMSDALISGSPSVGAEKYAPYACPAWDRTHHEARAMTQALKPRGCTQELELLERRGTSLKTKAETQAKYGW